MTDRLQLSRDDAFDLGRFAAELEALSDDPEDALQVLGTYMAALFPDGQPPLARLTWDEPQEGAGEPIDDVARLRQAQMRFRTLVEQIPAVTFMAVLGEGENEVYVSPHIEQMLKYTQEEWLSDPFLWYYRMHPEDRQLWIEEFVRGVRSGGPFSAECRFLARDGGIVWVHGEARLVKDGMGRPQFLQGVAFDITESKRAQEVLLRDAVRAARAEEELVIAHRVQLSVLPRRLDVEGLEIAARMEPADEVGGDYYDVRPFDGGAWIGIGDVSGHGLSAGLVMLMVQSAMAGIERAGPASSPKEMVCALNEVLYENIRERLGDDDHVTFSLLRYTRDGLVVVAGAHEDILVWRSRRGCVETIRPPGTWIGAMRDISRVTVDAPIQLEDGDVVLLYTDGITEARDAEGAMFDIARLSAALEQAHDRPVQDIRDHILSRVHAHQHEQEDDITILVMRYRAEAEPTASGRVTVTPERDGSGAT